MSWLFSQALVEEYSAANCLDGVPSAQLNVMPTPQGFWRNDKMTDCSNLSQFGQTLQLLTVDLGGDLLTWFRAVSPAKIFQQPEPEPGLTANVPDSGWKWPESSVKYDPLSALWRIRQCSLLGASDVFSETWPRWGTMRNGECWERQTWERRTNGTEYGLLPTPLASIATHGGPNQRDSSGRPGLQMAAMSWPTPTVCGNYNRKGASKNSGDGLATAVAKWPTPTKSDGTGGPGCSGRAGGLNLRTAVTKFPTPTSSMVTTGDMEQARFAGNGSRPSYEEANKDGGPLNPHWVEWLMGWPIGWTNCEPLATDRCHSALQKHG